LTEKYGEPVVPDSAFERMVEQLLLDAGIRRPVLQHEVYDEQDAFVARLDLAYPDRLVGVELDGRRHIEDAAFERDPRRRNRLTALGWTIYHYTWRHYVDHPELLCAEIRAAIR
jgi:very-short-patch-repair endonuclease